MIGTWISVIGSIASIGGAIWAFVEARKSSRAATKAEKVRDEIISRRKLIEVSQVHAETARILKIVSTVGPACNPSLLRGVNCGSIAKDVEEYSRYINEHSSHFNDFSKIKPKSFVRICIQILKPFLRPSLLTIKRPPGKAFITKSIALCHLQKNSQMNEKKISR